MSHPDFERKRELLRQLADELGVKLQGIGDNQRGGGFSAQRYHILAETADQFAKAMKGATLTEYRQSAAELVDIYWKNNTRRTEKSDKGGTRIGYTHIVKCGSDAAHIFSSLQARIENWQKVRATAPTNEPRADRTLRIATADRYLQNRKAHKHAGRPFRTFGKVQVKASAGGTPRDSIVVEVARMFLEHGDCVLSDDVLDAILDNGGPLQVSPHFSPEFLDLIMRCESMIASDGTPRPERMLLEKALNALHGAPVA